MVPSDIFGLAAVITDCGDDAAALGRLLDALRVQVGEQRADDLWHAACDESTGVAP